MEDIITSIRSSVEVETARSVGSMPMDSGDDVLDLSKDDIADEAEPEEIKEVVATPEVQADTLTAIAAGVAAAGAMDEIDLTAFSQKPAEADARKLLDPEKSDDEVAAEIDALLNQVKSEKEPTADIPTAVKPTSVEQQASPAEAPMDIDAMLAAEATPATPEVSVSMPLDDIDSLMASTDATAKPLPNAPALSAAATLVDAAVEDVMAAMMGDMPESVAAAESETSEVAAETPAEIPAEDVIMAETAAQEPVIEDTPTPAPVAAQPALDNKKGKRMNLNAVPSSSGLQVAFPAEVLAEALRPLVHEWVSENLPEIVERLVREELRKLAGG
ncbi:MAG: DUF2497 domain-containing protein [Alphaproteobacteria bacterium]